MGTIIVNFFFIFFCNSYFSYKFLSDDITEVLYTAGKTLRYLLYSHLIHIWKVHNSSELYKVTALYQANCCDIG